MPKMAVVLRAGRNTCFSKILANCSLKGLNQGCHWKEKYLKKPVIPKMWRKWVKFNVSPQKNPYTLKLYLLHNSAKHVGLYLSLFWLFIKWPSQLPRIKACHALRLKSLNLKRFIVIVTSPTLAPCQTSSSGILSELCFYIPMRFFIASY